MNFNQDLFGKAKERGVRISRIGRYLFGNKWRKIYRQGILSEREIDMRAKIENAIEVLSTQGESK